MCTKQCNYSINPEKEQEKTPLRRARKCITIPGKGRSTPLKIFETAVLQFLIRLLSQRKRATKPQANVL